MVARGPKGVAGKSGTSPGRQQQQRQQPGGNPNQLKTSKGNFSFTMVADGCYIEHKWGANSGHVGVPLEAMPGFIQKMQALYQKTTGEALKSPKGTGPKATIAKGGKLAKKKEQEKKKKEKKPPPPKKTMEDLDAELASFTALRNADGTAAGEASEAPAMAE